MSATIGVTLLPVAPPFGADYMGYALTLILLAGLIQMLFLLIRPLGRMLDLINEPIINGLICGIGLFLIFKSLTSFAGLPINTEVEWPLWIAWQSFLAVLEIGNLYAIEMGLITLITMRDRAAVRPPAQLGDPDRRCGRHGVFGIPERHGRPAEHADRANRQSVVDRLRLSLAAAFQPGGHVGHHLDPAGRRDAGATWDCFKRWRRCGA